MDPTVQGAVVGAIAAIVGALLATWLQMRQDRLRIKQSREDAVAKELSDSLQLLTIRTAASLHSMCWLTWRAKERGDRVRQTHLDAYDAEQHRLLPEIIGYLSTVAAVNIEVYRQLRPHVDKVFDLDARIAATGLWLDRDNANTIAGLAALFNEANEMERGLPLIVGNIVGEELASLIPVVSRTRSSAPSTGRRSTREGTVT